MTLFTKTPNINRANAKRMTPKHNQCHAKCSLDRFYASRYFFFFHFMNWAKYTSYIESISYTRYLLKNWLVNIRIAITDLWCVIYLQYFEISPYMFIDFGNSIGLFLVLHLVWHYRYLFCIYHFSCMYNQIWKSSTTDSSTLKLQCKLFEWTLFCSVIKSYLHKLDKNFIYTLHRQF